MDPISVHTTTFEKYGSPLESAVDAKSLAETIIEHAEQMLLDHGEVQPAVVFLHEDQVTLAPLSFESEEQKDLVSEFITTLGGKLGAHAIGFVSESWMAQAETDDKEEVAKIVPSKHPNRKEILMATTTWRDVFGKERAARVTYIKRDDEGKITDLFRDDNDLEDLSKCSGRFVF